MENNQIIGLMTQSDVDDTSQKNKGLIGSDISILDVNEKSFTGYLGDALNDSNINSVIDEIPPHLIILVGFPKHGKSTFVSSLYHVVLTEGKIGENKFIDSDTILGFERRVFVRRYEQNFKKRLNRTSLLENYFLTLDFIDKNSNRKKLVISDRSGEAYKQYCDNVDEMREDQAIGHANHIVFFLDASKLLNVNTITDCNLIKQLIGRFKNAKIINPSVTFDLIFNKIDTIQGKEDRYKKNKREIIEAIKTEGDIKINREFEINSDKTEDNSDLRDVFSYFVDSCNSVSVKKDESVANQLDWVKCKLM